jgi:hypothetical protein
VVSILLILLVGSIGGYLGVYFKLPSGTMIGALTAVAIFKLSVSNVGRFPEPVEFFIQVCVGSMVGLSVTTKLLKDIKDNWFLVFFSSVLLIALGLLVGYMLAKFKFMDLTTAILSTMPGGLASLGIIAVNNGANASLVALFHFVRLVCLLVFASFLVKWFGGE